MNTRRLVFSLLLFVFPLIGVQAQIKTSFFKDIEIFGGIGTANYFGDIGGKDTADWPRDPFIMNFFDNLDIDWSTTRMGFSAGARFTRWNNFALSVQLSPIFLSGSDKDSNYEYRDLLFNTTVLEFSGLAEYYLAKRITGFAPYGFLGFGGLFSFGSANFTVNNLYQATKVNPYTHFNSGGVSTIVGIGLRLPALNRMTHSFDFCYHFTTTDLLDGLKTPRTSGDLFVTLSYKINIESYTLWTYDHRGLVK